MRPTLDIGRLLTLANYRVTQRLEENARVALYRAVDASGRSVILKITHEARPDRQQISRLRREYEILQRLQPACGGGLPQPFALLPIDTSLAMAIEDIGGESLDALIKSGAARAMPVSDFLTLAASLVDTLARVHDAQIVHRDIKPANIVLDIAGNRIQLIDFGLASRITHHARANRTATRRSARRLTPLHGTRTDGADEPCHR